MLHAVGYVITKPNGRYVDHLRPVCIKAEIDIFPNLRKLSDSQLDFRVLTEGIKIGSSCSKKTETSSRKYVSQITVALSFVSSKSI
jgi:uncharacterized protein (DUF736 family)